jgi:hypothetical protein
MCTGASLCNVNSPNWKEMIKEDKNHFDVKWISGVNNYQFRVRACNDCGCSKSCLPLVVKRPTVPHPC